MLEKKEWRNSAKWFLVVWREDPTSSISLILAKCKRGEYSSVANARELSIVLEESYFRSSSSDQPIELLDEIRAREEAHSNFHVEKEDRNEVDIGIQPRTSSRFL
jgi:hypothetical protein